MLCKNISRLRKSRGLTQIEFAKRLNVTQGAVSQWENGRTMPDTYQLLRIAKAFDITVDELTNGVDVFPADMSEPEVFIEPSTKGSQPPQEVTVTATGPDGVTQQLMHEAVHDIGQKPLTPAEEAEQIRQDLIAKLRSMKGDKLVRISQYADLLKQQEDMEKEAKRNELR